MTPDYLEMAREAVKRHDNDRATALAVLALAEVAHAALKPAQADPATHHAPTVDLRLGLSVADRETVKRHLDEIAVLVEPHMPWFTLARLGTLLNAIGGIVKQGTIGVTAPHASVSLAAAAPAAHLHVDHDALDQRPAQPIVRLSPVDLQGLSNHES
jgi:hypothetical protein